MFQLINAAAQLPNLLPDAFQTFCVCGGALRLQPVQHGSFVQFQRLGMGADLAQYKLRQRHLIDGVPGTRAVAGGRITGAEIGNVLFGRAVLAALRLPVALKGCFTVGADELAGEQEGLRRRVVRREQRPFPVDGLHFIPYLRGDDGFMQSLMPYPFGFRLIDHGVVLIGARAGLVLNEISGVDLVCQYVLHRGVHPKVRVLAGAVAVQLCPIPAWGQNALAVQHGGDLAVGHACPPQLKHPAHHGGCFLVDHQPVPVLLALAVAVGGVGGDILAAAHFGVENGFDLARQVFQMVVVHQTAEVQHIRVVALGVEAVKDGYEAAAQRGENDVGIASDLHKITAQPR